LSVSQRRHRGGATASAHACAILHLVNPEVIQQRIHQLDLFRFIAALAVVCFHYFHMGPFFGFYSKPGIPVEQVARYGFLGVQMFFIISGFVIAMSANGKSAREFLRGRAIRLLPLFWVACLFTFAVIRLAGPASLKVSTASLAASLVMLPAVTHRFRYVDGVYWTLAFEWLFYAGMAAALRTGLYKKHLSKVLFAWLALSAAMLGTDGSHWVLRFITVAEYSPYFVAGVGCYRLYTQRAEFGDIFNLAVSFMLAVKWSQKHVAEFQTIYPLSEPVVVSLVCAIFLMFLLFSTGKLEWLNKKAFAPLGALTYALYLTHQNIGYAMLGAKGGTYAPTLLAVAGVVLCALILAFLMHRYVERPISTWLRPVKPSTATLPKWKKAPTLDDMTFG
jgi:peptidoglycan/LPS O-acetylase OafA/YrhL